MEGNKTELLTQKKRAETSNVPAINTKAAAATAKDNKTDGMQAPESDGLLEVEKASLLRFTEDDRVHEVVIVALCTRWIACSGVNIRSIYTQFALNFCIVLFVDLSHAPVLSAVISEVREGSRGVGTGP